MSKRKKKKQRSGWLTPAVPAPVQQAAIPKSVQTRQVRMMRMMQLSTRVTTGPIPSAEEMARYAQVLPDLPERIMRQFERRTEMAERQAEHRMGMEKSVVGNNVLMERLGWFSATLLGLVVLGGSIALIWVGKSLEGLAGIIMALTSLLGLYVWARRDQVQAITKKRAADMVSAGATPEQLDLLAPGNE